MGVADQIDPAIAAYDDPRDGALGKRLIGPHALVAEMSARLPALEGAAHERLRMTRHVPGSADLEPGKFFPLDLNFEEANGVDFRKGCYVGQEVTSRMKHRASARKRLVTVHLDAAAAPGTPILAGDHAIGELRAIGPGAPGGPASTGLALVRLDRLIEARDEARPLTCGANRIEVDADDWWQPLVRA